MSFVEVEQNIGINKNDQDFTYTPHPAYIGMPGIPYILYQGERIRQGQGLFASMVIPSEK